MRRLLAFLDPLLGCAPLIIESHYRPAGQAQVRDDKADSRKQLVFMVLDLGRCRTSNSIASGRLKYGPLYAHLWEVYWGCLDRNRRMGLRRGCRARA